LHFLLLIACVSALQLQLPSSGRLATVRPQVPARHIVCIATSKEEKALFAASKKVTLVAKSFGPTQGKAAQAWVEEALKSGDATADTLVQMQLALFDECKLDDESGRCKALSSAVDALTAAVAERKNKPKTSVGRGDLTGTPIQEAATKLRKTATLFGPEQKEAADKWIKKIISGQVSSGEALLEEQVTLFGECVLSEGSTPSNCEKLDTALSDLQDAIDLCNIDAPEDCSSEDVAADVVADAELALATELLEIADAEDEAKA